ncbi:uncharacterized protein SPSK_10166 [Sporothrix schenckii 1099-18]|uniref:Uncharacterized protein n=1 Tax=Sporothrix schenckii 1099-18 TaxID=1397361 RepID=A0A0F2MCY2_SPOSC|nr:uncharacterized protein SPSK_10166 [Sporothrix schenckii 1099-18]KJR86006.1 hypothetical protein SPSK_10166 [Sporothrix schenckii 1099-18]
MAHITITARSSSRQVAEKDFVRRPASSTLHACLDTCHMASADGERPEKDDQWTRGDIKSQDGLPYGHSSCVRYTASRKRRGQEKD